MSALMQNCLYCVNEYVRELTGCVSSCLQSSGVEPHFAGGILYSTAALAAMFFLFSFLFKNDLKKFLGFRLASIGFFAMALFSLASIFTIHTVFKSLPLLIPLVGIGSYLVSHFFSFNILKKTYAASELEKNYMKKTLKRFSTNLKISSPKIFTFKSAEPRAFSVDGFKKAIFLSENLVSILSKRDLSAVLLHELYHLKRRSGAWKNFFSAAQILGLRILPLPIDLLEKYEEKEIDEIIAAEHGVDVGKVRNKLWNK